MPKPQSTGSRSRQQRKQEAKKLGRRSRSGQGDNYRRYQVVLATLMMAAGLAYLWIVYLDRYAQQTGWDKVIHRTDRCDLSLFQLGLDLLEHFLNEGLPIPVAFQMSMRLEGVPYLLPEEV